MPQNIEIDYAYTRDKTEDGTGFFSCRPDMGFADAAAVFAERPNDDFLRQHLLSLCAGGAGAPAPGSRLERLLEDARAGHESAFASAWRANRLFGTALPPDLAAACALWRRSCGASARAEGGENEAEAEDCDTLPQARDVWAEAVARLEAAGLFAGPEMRHEASLSPIGLLRDWRVDLRVNNGRHRHRLRGTATAYGRGLGLWGARASLAMEIVERASAYAGVDDGAVCGRAAATPLLQASHDELAAGGANALDPAEAPFRAGRRDARLHWLEGMDAAGRSVLVPAQCVFLFCNLDEPDFCRDIGSTGLAAGCTLLQAKAGALAEVVERHADAVTPVIPEDCFLPASREERLQALLDDYRRRGIHVQLQEIGMFGLPVYRAIVRAGDGRLVMACAAAADARRAVWSALTETPWPYAYAGPQRADALSAPAFAGLPVREIEALPGRSLGLAADVASLEAELAARRGSGPVYAVITRADLSFPVLRAIVPGLELDSGAFLRRLARP